MNVKIHAKSQPCDAQGRLWVVVGGSGSGKSKQAEAWMSEALILQNSILRNPITQDETGWKSTSNIGAVVQGVYLATMKRDDEPETIERIQRHRAQREHLSLELFETSTLSEIHKILKYMHNRPVMLDCLGNLIANEWFSSSNGDIDLLDLADRSLEKKMELVVERMVQTLRSIQQIATHLVIVGNNFFGDLPISNTIIIYQKLVSMVHIALSQYADRWTVMHAGQVDDWHPHQHV